MRVWGVDVGDWATWFSSALTGFSLILGFSILRRDRRNEERAQAERIVVNSREVYRRGGTETTVTYDVTVWNHSDQPIFSIYVDGLWKGITTRDMQVEGEPEMSGSSLLLPGQVARWHGEVAEEDAAYGDYGVVFTDSHGLRWALDARRRSVERYRTRLVLDTLTPRTIGLTSRGPFG